MPIEQTSAVMPWSAPCNFASHAEAALRLHQVSIQLPEGFTPTCMAHPDTYLNKVVVGSQEGKLQLWNFASGKMLYEFTGLGDAAVHCIAPSPALDVVGLGMSDGCVSLSVIYLTSCFCWSCLLQRHCLQPTHMCAAMHPTGN